jgi:DNA-binding MarR family transcriptional regulator
MMARIVAKRLVDHLEQSGFVIVKRPPTRRRGDARSRV